MNFIRKENGKHFGEHQIGILDDNLGVADLVIEDKLFRNKPDSPCFYVQSDGGKRNLLTSYYIGVDWLDRKKHKAICVEPKINNDDIQTDYLKMLNYALGVPDAFDYLDDLFEVKLDEEFIEIEQKLDFLTPLLISLFLHDVRRIVQKGLKKSYYKVESNLYAKVKGKILVSETVKYNIVKNRTQNTYCAYEVFGINNAENQLLKKALVYVQSYILHPNSSAFIQSVQHLMGYVTPAFQEVSDKFNVHEIKYQKPNSLYKEYGRATELAKLIIQKFGYNINNVETDYKLRTPPFWIDMSKLFEMYVLGLLKEKYTSDLLYQFPSLSGIPDFLLTKKDAPMVIDAKYKPVYKNDAIFYGEYLISDIRQLSGYARDENILNAIGVSDNVNVDCLIIYPLTGENGEMSDLDFSNARPLKGFNGFYKLGIKLPNN